MQTIDHLRANPAVLRLLKTKQNCLYEITLLTLTRLRVCLPRLRRRPACLPDVLDNDTVTIARACRVTEKSGWKLFLRQMSSLS